MSFLAGATVFIGVATWLDRRAEGRRAEGANVGFGLLAGVVLDGIPEHLAMHRAGRESERPGQDLIACPSEHDRMPGRGHGLPPLRPPSRATPAHAIAVAPIASAPADDQMGGPPLMSAAANGQHGAARHRVVIIGAGFGGLFAARALRRAPVET